MGAVDYNIKKSSKIKWPVRWKLKRVDLTQEDKAAPTLSHLPSTEQASLPMSSLWYKGHVWGPVSLGSYNIFTLGINPGKRQTWDTPLFQS